MKWGWEQRSGMSTALSTTSPLTVYWDAHENLRTKWGWPLGFQPLVSPCMGCHMKHRYNLTGEAGSAVAALYVHVGCDQSIMRTDWQPQIWRSSEPEKSYRVQILQPSVFFEWAELGSSAQPSQLRDALGRKQSKPKPLLPQISWSSSSEVPNRNKSHSWKHTSFVINLLHPSCGARLLQ